MLTIADKYSFLPVRRGDAQSVQLYFRRFFSKKRVGGRATKGPVPPPPAYDSFAFLLTAPSFRPPLSLHPFARRQESPHQSSPSLSPPHVQSSGDACCAWPSRRLPPPTSPDSWLCILNAEHRILRAAFSSVLQFVHISSCWSPSSAECDVPRVCVTLLLSANVFSLSQQVSQRNCKKKAVWSNSLKGNLWFHKSFFPFFFNSCTRIYLNCEDSG